MRDAWKVLRGQAKACPVDATWYVAKTTTTQPSTVYFTSSWGDTSITSSTIRYS